MTTASLPTALIFLAVLAFIAARTLTERRRRINLLWLMPVLLLFVALDLPHQDGWLSSQNLLLAALGVAGGWVTGLVSARTLHIRLDERDPNFVLVQGSILTLTLLLGAVIARIAARVLVGSSGTALGATGALLAFTVAMVGARNLHVYLAANRLRRARSA